MQKATIVQIAVGIPEVAFEERFVESLFEHIHTEIAAIEFDTNVSYSRDKDSNIEEQLRTDGFAKQAIVLDRIVDRIKCKPPLLKAKSKVNAFLKV